MPSTNMAPGEMPDLQAFLEALPCPHLIVTPDAIMVAANEIYLKATAKNRETSMGRSFFDVFPHNAHQSGIDPREQLRESFARVVRYRRADTMAIVQYDIPIPE